MVESQNTIAVFTSKTRNCNNHKTTLFDSGEFIGWDGEGVTTKDGMHRYVLLMDSTGRELFNPEGISTRQGFEFLLQGIKPNRIHICFASGYDINKLLKDVPKNRLQELWDSQDHTSWGKYRMRYRKAKNFWLGDVRGSLTLWDVFSFFQCSFVKALDSYFPEEKDNEELIAIREMKARRSQFQLADIDSIRYYCGLELKWLVRLMERLREHMRLVNLKLSRWDGAGAVASCLLKRERTKDHQNQNLESIERALRAYYGGRIETTCVGATKGPIYQYDLRSAYPSIISILPSLREGTWLKHDIPRLESSFSLVKVEWDFSNDYPFYPLPFRSKNDSILFPKNGRGWYWGVEANDAKQFAKLFGGSITLLESYSYVRKSGSSTPFTFVENLYRERNTFRKNGNGAEMVLKLGLNSLYGKFQQQLGGTIEKFPTYFQPEWSGYITAATRAKLLRAACIFPNSVLMFATDALFTTKKLPLKLGENLGEWEETVYDGIIIIQPGVYYLIKDGKATIKSRGFGLEALADHRPVISAWKRGRTSIPIPTTRFVTLGSALASPKLFEEWGQWRTVDRELCLDGYNAKRHMILPEDIPKCAEGLVFTTPRESRDFLYLDEDSKPFSTIWNQEDSLEEELIDGVPYNVWLHETNGEEYYG